MRSAVNPAQRQLRRTAPFLAAIAALALTGSALAQDAAATGPEGDYPRVLGDPYVVDGVTYTPVDTMNYDQTGYASVRGEGAGIGGSHRTLPLPSYAEVTSLDSGRTILVRIDQRGPATGSNLIDLSPAAWTQLGLPQGAAVAVRVRRVNPPEAERALLRMGQVAPERMETPKGLLAVLVRKLPPAPPGALKPAIEPAPVATSPVLTKVPPAATPAATPAAVPPREAPKPPVASKPVPQPVTPAVPAIRPAATPAPAPKPTAAAVRPAAGTWFVQAAAFSSKTNAETAARALGGAVTPTGKLWRVRVGPLGSTAEAQAALAKVKAAGYADARVVRAP